MNISHCSKSNSWPDVEKNSHACFAPKMSRKSVLILSCTLRLKFYFVSRPVPLNICCAIVFKVPMSWIFTRLFFRCLTDWTHPLDQR